MSQFFTWQKGGFSNTYRLMAGGIEQGSLKKSSWSRCAEGILHGKRYAFRVRNMLDNQVSIDDPLSGTPIGMIRFNNWKSRATLTLASGGIFYWKYTDFLKYRWQLSDDEGTRIQYSVSPFYTKGRLVSDTDNEALLLAGLFIANHFYESVLVVILIVVFAGVVTSHSR